MDVFDAARYAPTDPLALFGSELATLRPQSSAVPVATRNQELSFRMQLNSRPWDNTEHTLQGPVFLKFEKMLLYVYVWAIGRQ